MSEINKTELSLAGGGDQILLLIAQLEKSHREELQRIQLQYLEKVRQVESGRLQAEKELEDLEDRFSELNEQYRAEVSRLNDEVTCASEELLEQQKALSELGNQLIRVESLRDNLDQERRGLLERLRAEEQRGVQERKRLEEDKKSFSEQLERLTAELSTSTEKRQQLEVVRAELEQRVAALESLRENLDQERRGLLERLRAEEQRGVQERKRLEEDKKSFSEQLERLTAELSTSTEKRQQLEVVRAELEQRVAALESLRENLDQERRGLLERLRAEEQRGVQERKRLEEDKKSFSEQLERLTAELSTSTEKRQQLEVVRAELEQRVAALESLRENLDQERRGLLERLRAEEQRGVQERKRLEEDKKSFSEQLERLTAELSTSTEKRQQLEVVRAELEQRVAALESLRENLDQERRGLLERLRAEEQRGVQERKRLEEDKKSFSEQLERLTAELSTSTEKRQQLEVVRAELEQRVAALESLRENLDQERRGLLERLRAEEQRGVQERKRLEEDKKSFSEQLERLTAELSTSTEKRQQLEVVRAELEQRVAALESLRENLDQERRGLLERLRAEEQRGVQERKRLEEDKKSFSEQLERLTAELSTSTEKRQQLEVVRAELEQRVAALESLRDNLDQERRGLLERLRAEEQRGVQERKRLEDERDFYRQAMIAAEQKLDLVRQGFLHQLQMRLDIGWKGFIELPAVIWSALRSAVSKKDNDAEAWLNQIEAEWKAQGANIAEDFIRRNARDPIALATGLTRLARLIAPTDQAAALSLAKEAAKADPRPFRRKWLAFIHFDAGHVEAAHDLLVSLPDGTDFSPSERKKAELIASRYRDLRADRSATLSPGPHSSPDTPSAPVVDLSPLPIEAGKTALNDEEKRLLDLKLQAAIAQGTEALRTFLDAQCNGHAKALRSFCHLRAAQIALDAGEDAEALRLADAVLNEDTNVTTLRAAARVFYNAAQLDRAKELVRLLEKKLGDKIKPNDRKFIGEVLGRAQLANWATLPAQSRSIPAHPKRVLNILAFSLPYTSVGYATRSHGLAIGIKNAGWDIRPYTRPGFPYDFKPELVGQQLPEADEIDGIVYRRIFDFNRKEMTEVEYMHAAIEHYERIIRQEEPEVVHAASNYVTALPALIAARRLGVPFVYEVRGFWEVTRSSRDEKFENTAKYRFMQLFEALTARHADHVITITSAMKEELMTRGVPEECISIAYNSVDPQRFISRPRNLELAAQLGIPENVPVIGYVGSFVDYEGLDDLVTACTRLKSIGHDFRLLLVGDGAVFEDLKRQVEQSGLADKAIMTGRVPHEMVEEYYSLVDIAPFPRKPWQVCELVSPLKPYEAMALEKAVVVSGTRALTEIVTHERSGLVFAKGDVGDLQAKLERLLRDAALRVGLGKTARQWVEQERSWDVAGRVCVMTYPHTANHETAV